MNRSPETVPDETILASSLGEEDRAAFAELVGSSPFAAYQQSLAWARNAQRSRRHAFLFFLCREGGEAIGAGVVRLSDLGPAARLATLQRGPVVRDLAKLGTVVTALKAALRARGVSSLVLGPRAAGEEAGRAAALLAGLGFRPLPPQSQPLHVATGKIRLDRPEQAVWAGFKQRGRRQVNKAAKLGLTVREAAGRADLEAYQRVANAFFESKPGYETAGLPDVLQQSAIVAGNGGAILVAEHEGEVIGGHAFVIQGREAIWLSMASSSDRPEIPRAYALLWEGIRAARRLGCESYDLAGLAEGEPLDAEEASRDQFKLAFAPERVSLLPAHVAALRPVRHALFFNARQLYRAARARMRKP